MKDLTTYQWKPLLWLLSLQWILRREVNAVYHTRWTYEPGGIINDAYCSVRLCLLLLPTLTDVVKRIFQARLAVVDTFADLPPFISSHWRECSNVQTGINSFSRLGRILDFWNICPLPLTYTTACQIVISCLWMPRRKETAREKITTDKTNMLEKCCH